MDHGRSADRSGTSQNSSSFFPTSSTGPQKSTPAMLQLSGSSQSRPSSLQITTRSLATVTVSM